MDISQQWGPREGRGYVAILITPHYGDTEKGEFREGRGYAAIWMSPNNEDPEKAGVM